MYDVLSGFREGNMPVSVASIILETGVEKQPNHNSVLSNMG